MKINQLDLKHLCYDRTYADYSDEYILIKGTITVAGNHPRERQDRPIILKNNAPFISCITRINGKLIEDADDLDVVMPMYNLLEYSKNYRKPTGSFYNYYRAELDDDASRDKWPFLAQKWSDFIIFNHLKTINITILKKNTIL